ERDWLAQDAFIGPEPPLPKLRTQDCHRCSAGSIIVGYKIAPAKRPDPDRGEKIRPNDLPLEPFRFGRAAKIETLLPALRRHGFERCALAAPISKIEIRSILQTPARIPFLNYYQPFRILVGKRAEQNRVDDAEDRRVRSDAQRQRQHDHRGEAGVLQQLAEGELEIIHVAMPPLDQLALHGARDDSWRHDRPEQLLPISSGESP